MRIVAGPWSAEYAGGELRDLRLKGVLVLSRLYAAVRDENWGTVPWALIQEEIGPEGVRFTSRHEADGIEYEWVGTIEAGPVEWSFHFEGVARSSFLRNRIGFCLLHPASAEGDVCEVERADGTRQEAALPREIDPAQPVEPFWDMEVFRHRLHGGGVVEVTFEGDLFEMEDQRNWTDASYKTFCTPLRLPFPVPVAEGERVRQTIRIRALSTRPLEVVGGGEVELDLTGEASAFPKLGFGWGEVGDLVPDYLRVDVDPDHYDRDIRRARSCVLPVQLGLLLGDDLESFAFRVAKDLAGVRIESVLALPHHERMAIRPDHGRLVGAVREAFPGVPILAGTDADYVFLNRYRPDPASVDGVCFTINPQVHAFDDASVMETLAMHGVVARDAAKLGVPVHVSAVTLKPRHNPYANQFVPRGEPLGDDRHGTVFCAAWTLASLKNLAEAGVASATYYEASGPRGVLGNALEPIFRRILEVAPTRILHVRSSDPSKVVGLVLEGSRQVGLLANLTPEPHAARFRSQPLSLGPYGWTEIA